MTTCTTEENRGLANLAVFAFCCTMLVASFALSGYWAGRLVEDPSSVAAGVYLATSLVMIVCWIYNAILVSRRSN